MKLFTVLSNRKAVFIFFFAIVFQAVGLTTVSAIGNDYFDFNDLNDGSRVRIIVGQTRYVRESGAELKAYFTTNAGRVTFHEYNYCLGNNGDSLETEDAAGQASGSSDLSSGDDVTRFRVLVNNSVDTQFNGSYYPRSSDRCDDDRTINLSNLPMDPAGSGYYVASISVDHNDRYQGDWDGIMNGFYVTVDGPGAVVTHAAAASDRKTGAEVTLEQVDDDPEYTNYSIKFGSDCTVTSAVTKVISFYDIDNDGGSGAQQGRKVDMVLYESNADGSNRHIIKIANTDNWTPPSSNNDTTNAAFTAQPAKRYELIVKDVYYNNTLQFVPPFDGIFYLKPCEPNALRANITPIASVEPGIVEVGTLASARMGVRNSGPARGDVSYTRTFWFERNGVEAGGAIYDASDELIGSVQTGTLSVDGDTTIPLAEWRNITAKSNGNITHICTSVRLVATGPNTDIGSPNPAISCADIGKYPHLEVKNGDIFAGGMFQSYVPDCRITRAARISSSQRFINGVNYTSFATYGVTSLGATEKFGSQGLSFGVPTSENLIFANPATASQGYFYNPAGNTAFPAEPRCMNDPFTRFGPQATTTSAATRIDLSQPGVGNTVMTATGNVFIRASSDIRPNTRIVIRVTNANVNIESDIKYQDTVYNSINQLPQIVILAEHNLIVLNNVKQIDGILAAKKTFYTCNVAPKLNGDCNNPLTVNGAVIAGESVVPVRGAGAEMPDLSAMAETFNLRPDVLLNQLPEAGNGDVYVRTMSETELPPRF